MGGGGNRITERTFLGCALYFWSQLRSFCLFYHVQKCRRPKMFRWRLISLHKIVCIHTTFRQGQRLHGTSKGGCSEKIERRFADYDLRDVESKLARTTGKIKSIDPSTTDTQIYVLVSRTYAGTTTVVRGNARRRRDYWFTEENETNRQNDDSRDKKIEVHK